MPKNLAGQALLFSMPASLVSIAVFCVFFADAAVHPFIGFILKPLTVRPSLGASFQYSLPDFLAGKYSYPFLQAYKIWARLCWAFESSINPKKNAGRYYARFFVIAHRLFPSCLRARAHAVLRS